MVYAKIKASTFRQRCDQTSLGPGSDLGRPEPPDLRGSALLGTPIYAK